MMLLALSAATIGFIHSLAPGHWLPVALVAKSRKWSPRTAIMGALVAASGHITVSLILGLLGILVGAHLLEGREEEIERYGSLILIAFGLIYAIQAYFRHSSCHGHGHHGPVPDKKKAPFAFLFGLGFSPCVAVFPVFAAAATRGSFAVTITMLGFSAGVISALLVASQLALRGLSHLDHPILEHYGDVLTGLGIVLMGGVLFLFPH